MMSDNNYDNWIVVQTRRVVFLNFLLLRFSYPQESLIKALVWSDSRPLINRGISKSIRHFIRHSTIQSSNHHTSTCFMINTIIQWEKFINFLSAAKQYAMLNIFYDGGCWQQNTKQCLQGFKYFCEIWWNILRWCLQNPKSMQGLKYFCEIWWNILRGRLQNPKHYARLKIFLWNLMKYFMRASAGTTRVSEFGAYRGWEGSACLRRPPNSIKLF